MKNLICDMCGENNNSNQFCDVENEGEMLLCEECIDLGLFYGIVIQLSKESKSEKLLKHY